VRALNVDRLAALVYVMICAVGVGYWVVPSDSPATVAEPKSESRPVVASLASAPVMAAAVVSTQRPSAAPRVDLVSHVRAAEPALHARIKPLLNRGTNLAVASSEFASAVDFAAVAHASRNTGIPFMVLKYRVVSQGMTLEAAIEASKPDLNSAGEANLALAEAHADLAAIAR